MKNIAILFPGQGSQYIGMGEKLYNQYSIAREVFEEACDVLNFDIKKLCFKGDFKELAKTENTQPAVLTASVAAFQVLLNESGIKPKYLAGHSLGEISALVCANSVKFSDALSTVRLRGRYMQEAVPVGSGLMIAVNGIDPEHVREVCKRVSLKDNIVVPSNYNSPLQTVISGNRNAVEQAGKMLEEDGASIVTLNVSAPFHCQLMEPVKEKLSLYLSNMSYNEFEYPVLSNVTALPYSNKNGITDMITAQIVRPVQWTKLMHFLQMEKIAIVIDIGPNDVLKKLIRNGGYDFNTISFDKENDVIGKLMQGIDSEVSTGNDGLNRLEFMERCLSAAICTPNRNVNESQEKEIECYKNMKQLFINLKSKNIIPDEPQIKQSLDMLQAFFLAKKTPLNEQKARLEELLENKETYSDILI